MLASLLKLPAAQPLGQEVQQPGSASPRQESAADARQEQVEFCDSLEAAVAAFGLEGCWTWKPLLNGKQVQLHGVYLRLS